MTDSPKNLLENLGDIDATILADLQREIPQVVRDAMLDLVLAWASLDMATAFFLASLSGLDPDLGAEKYGRKEIADKFKRTSKLLDEAGEHDRSAEIKKIAEAYPSKALYRRRIAHARCAGVRKSDPEKLVFLPYEREGAPGNLAIEIFDVSLLIDARNWADAVHGYLMAMVDQADFFQVRASSVGSSNEG